MTGFGNFLLAGVASMLERLAGRSADARGEQQAELLLAQALVDVSKRASSKAVSDFRVSVTEGIRQPDLRAFWLETMSAQLHRLCGDSKSAKRHTLAAADALERVPGEFTAPIICRATHFANVLKLGKAGLPDTLTQQARSFFDEYIRSGYFAFRALGTDG